MSTKPQYLMALYCTEQGQLNWLYHKALFEWMGCAAGIIGTIFLALNANFNLHGFIAYVISNLCWLRVAQLQKTLPLFVMQAVFLCLGLFGIYRAI